MTTITEESTRTFNQRKHWRKSINYHGEDAVIAVTARYDDDCRNGHNTFSLTADVRATDRRRNPSDGGWIAGGCLHEEIAKHFPGLAPLIKWHLCSSDGPMHYLANAVYFASDRDCHGKRAGEPSAFSKVVRWHDFPIDWNPGRHTAFINWLEQTTGVDFEVIRIEHPPTQDKYKFAPNYTLGGAPDKWHECPFDTEEEALQFLAAMRRGYIPDERRGFKVLSIPTAWSEGKARELDKARSAAIWPDATDEELTAPGLKERLEARLPGLLVEFRAAMESLGFKW